MNSYPGLAEAASCRVEELETWFNSKKSSARSRLKVALAGILQNVTKKSTKKGSMMARFDIADETGSREVVAFSRTYEDIAQLLSNDSPVVLIADISDDDDSVRIVADKLYRWDASNNLPEIAVLEFSLSDVNEHQLTDLRSYLDDYAGITPVQLRCTTDKGVLSYDTDNIRLDKVKLDELQQHCPWLQATLTINTVKLLAERADNGYRRNPQAVSAPVDVPF